MNLWDRESVDRQSASAASCREHRHSCNRPIVFRCDDAVPDGDDFRIIDLDFRLKTRGGRNEVVGVLQVDRPIAYRERHSWFAFDSSQRNLLGVTAVWVSRLQPDFPELIRYVINGKFLAFCPRCTSFEFIRRKNLDVRQ